MIAYYGQMKFESLNAGPLSGLIAAHFSAPLYHNEFMVASGQRQADHRRPRVRHQLLRPRGGQPHGPRVEPARLRADAGAQAVDHPGLPGADRDGQVPGLLQRPGALRRAAGPGRPAGRRRLGRRPVAVPPLRPLLHAGRDGDGAGLQRASAASPARSTSSTSAARARCSCSPPRRSSRRRRWWPRSRARSRCSACRAAARPAAGAAAARGAAVAGRLAGGIAAGRPRPAAMRRFQVCSQSGRGPASARLRCDQSARSGVLAAIVLFVERSRRRQTGDDSARARDSDPAVTRAAGDAAGTTSSPTAAQADDAGGGVAIAIKMAAAPATTGFVMGGDRSAEQPTAGVPPYALVRRAAGRHTRGRATSGARHRAPNAPLRRGWTSTGDTVHVLRRRVRRTLALLRPTRVGGGAPPGTAPRPTCDFTAPVRRSTRRGAAGRAADTRRRRRRPRR